MKTQKNLALSFSRMKELFFLLVLFFAVITSCEKNESRLINSNGYTFEEAKVKLGEIAETLASNHKWVTKFSTGQESGILLNELQQGNVSLSKVLDDTTQGTIIINGVMHTIKLELVNHDNFMNKLSKLTSIEAIAVGVDPDKFGPVDEAVPVTVCDGEGGITKVEYINLPYPQDTFLEDDEEDIQDQALENAINELAYPVFMVTTEETYDDPEVEQTFFNRVNEVISLNKITSIKPFFVIKEIKLRKDEDPWGNEEFEVYVGDVNKIYGETIHKFNGNHRNDAAHQYRRYKDVNDEGTYTMSEPIAIFPLNNSSFRIIALDDDNTAGIHRSNSSGHDRYSSVRFYRTSANIVLFGNWTFNTYNLFQLQIADDIYKKSGMDDITLSNMNLRLNQGTREYFNTDERTSGYLKGVRWTVGIKNYDVPN